MDACPGLIAKDNSISFNMIWSSIIDLVDGKDLSLGRLGLKLSAEVIPEFGFSDDIIASKETNGINFGAGISVSRKLTAHDKKLPGLGYKN